jgi:hypothetical protein
MPRMAVAVSASVGECRNINPRVNARMSPPGASRLTIEVSNVTSHDGAAGRAPAGVFPTG